VLCDLRQITSLFWTTIFSNGWNFQL
jgi:hypothetical protein